MKDRAAGQQVYQVVDRNSVQGQKQNAFFNVLQPEAVESIYNSVVVTSSMHYCSYTGSILLLCRSCKLRNTRYAGYCWCNPYNYTRRLSSSCAVPGWEHRRRSTWRAGPSSSRSRPQNSSAWNPSTRVRMTALTGSLRFRRRTSRQWWIRVSNNSGGY